MTLHAIVAALGGEIYAGGVCASIPAPGHSARDRSVSLRLVDGRVLVHGFGSADWREILDDLRSRGLIDAQNRPASGAGGGALWRPSRRMVTDRERIAAARDLWSEGGALARTLSERHLRRRRVRRLPPSADALRHHPSAPISAYRPSELRKPALMAGIRAPNGVLRGVELTYLDADGQRARRLKLPRKTIGVLQPGSAVRLDPAGPELLVAEGIFTTLSAGERFHLPAWALLSAGNLRSWRPPAGVRRVLIAADRGAEGERSAEVLAAALDELGVEVAIELPPVGCGDWNDAA